MNFPEPVSHEAFMQQALFDPQEGYYATRAAVGISGDFSTSATLSPAFAEAIASWAQKTTKALGLSRPCPLIELGPGNGTLAKALAIALPDWPLHLVETSPLLRSTQNEQLAKIPFQHHADLCSALEQVGAIGLIIANEFMDAFPAVKLRWQDEDWREVAISFQGGKPEEVLLPLSREIDADAPAHPREGESIYVHPSFRQWLQSNLPYLDQGVLLFIDYGAERPARECRAYQQQKRYEGLEIYDEPGRRDITCDVNFTDLKRWCDQLGLATSVPVTQGDFLEENLSDFETRRREDEALAFLSHPLGAGGAFKTLVAFRGGS